MNLTSQQPPLLHWLPDESFYSLCSRQHILMGSQSPKETLNFLFGNSATGFSHDFPKNLNSLSDRATSCWGSPDEIICDHTISPLFFPFQSSENILKLKEALSGPQIGSLKYKLGLVTGRFGGSHPLKSCLKCMSADQSNYGSAYWHLSHQIPGVTVCPAHGCFLMECTENRQWSKDYQWLLPDENTLVSNSQAAISASTLTALRVMSESAVLLRRIGITTQFDPSTVARVYKNAFTKLEASKNTPEAAADSFAHHCSELQMYPPFGSLPCSRMCAIGFISEMTRKPRGYCHPLKHLALISWLFGRVESFVDAYQQSVNQLPTSAEDHRDTLALDETIDDQSLLIDRKPGAPRPKKLFNELKEKVLREMIDGASKEEVCSRFGLSISTVNRLLRLNSAACQQITENRHFKKTSEQREAWVSMVDKTPNVSINSIKKLIPNVYAWLYRNDRPWLISQANSLPSGRIGNHVSIDWDARDEKLLSLVEKAIATRPSDLKKFRKRDLYQTVPNLFSALEQKSKYPKTRRFIAKIFN